MTSYVNATVSGVPMRIKLVSHGNPDDAGFEWHDIQRADQAFLTRRQVETLPANVGFGSRVTVRFPSINKHVRGVLNEYTGGSGLIDFDGQLALTRNQARTIRAAEQSAAVR